MRFFGIPNPLPMVGWESEPLSLSNAWRKILASNLCAPRSQNWERVEKNTHGLFCPKSYELWSFQRFRGSELCFSENIEIFHLAFVWEIWVSSTKYRISRAKSTWITEIFEMIKLQYNPNRKPRGCFSVRSRHLGDLGAQRNNGSWKSRLLMTWMLKSGHKPFAN